MCKKKKSLPRGYLVRIALPNPNQLPMDQRVQATTCSAADFHAGPLQAAGEKTCSALAPVAVSDSGGVQEEAPTFGLQILITRDTTERPEVVESDLGRLVASNCNAIVEGVRRLTSSHERQRVAKPNRFGKGGAINPVAAALTGGDRSGG